MTTPALLDVVDARYHTGWRRMGAAWLDQLALLPVDIFFLWIGARVTDMALLTLLYSLNATYRVAYSVWLHGCFGQTLGKMFVGVKVLDVTGRGIGMRQALRRDSPLILLSIANAVVGTSAIVDGANPLRLEGLALPMFFVGSCGLIWLIAELVTMLTNRKRRAIHDWIGGTVVVREPTRADASRPIR